MERSFSILVIRKPEGWIPQNSKDFPTTYEALWVELTGVRKRIAKQISRCFNQASLQNHGITWAVAIPERGRIGGRAA